VTGKENNAFDFKRLPTFFATFSFPFRHLSEISRGVDIKEVIETINRMQDDGVIDRYAIGGAVGATFYLEPVGTLDVEVSLNFTSRRSRMEGEHGVRGRRRVDCMDRVAARSSDWDIASQYIVIAGWPVQFLPCRGSLLEEALAQAVEKDVDCVRARVFTPRIVRIDHNPPESRRGTSSTVFHLLALSEP
jgi:hypothetical protein